MPLCVLLHLKGIHDPNLECLFRDFALIEYLVLSECSLLSPPANTTAPMLRSMCIKESAGGRGLMQATFPHLESFSCHGLCLPFLLSFLARHWQVTELSVGSNAFSGVKFEQLVEYTTQVTSLTLSLHCALDLVEGCIFLHLNCS